MSSLANSLLVHYLPEPVSLPLQICGCVSPLSGMKLQRDRSVSLRLISTQSARIASSSLPPRDRRYRTGPAAHEKRLNAALPPSYAFYAGPIWSQSHKVTPSIPPPECWGWPLAKQPDALRTNVGRPTVQETSVKDVHRTYGPKVVRDMSKEERCASDSSARPGVHASPLRPARPLRIKSGVRVASRHPLYVQASAPRPMSTH